MNKILEYTNKDIEPIDSFRIKDELNKSVWNGDVIKENIRRKLLFIANDFYDTVDLGAEIKDIILTGSLANYNWSTRYSDYDLHILIDYLEVDENFDLVKKISDLCKK